MISLIIFLLALVFLVVCASFDIINTHRGLIRGLAVEGNSWIVAIFGNKPSLLALYVFDVVIWVLMAVPGVLGLHFENYALLGASIGAFLAFGGHHIQGGLKWGLLLQGKPLPTTNSMTAWQKFVGWLSYNW